MNRGNVLFLIYLSVSLKKNIFTQNDVYYVSSRLVDNKFPPVVDDRLILIVLLGGAGNIKATTDQSTADEQDFSPENIVVTRSNE